MIEPLLTLIAPHECLQCTTEGSLLCENCMQKLPLPDSTCYRCEQSTTNFVTCKSCSRNSLLHSVVPYTQYVGIAKDLIWNLKFSRTKAAARDIARQLHIPTSHDGHPMVIIFVPTATSRIRVRGYDQARLIAQSLARLHRITLMPALVRIGQHRQVGASGQMRRAQLHQAFRTTYKAQVAGKHIVLVDDVVTSGATLDAAATVLKKAGAWRIDASIFARAGTPLRS
jgi:ComF family protein